MFRCYLIATLALVNTVYGWSIDGHLFVANIAENLLLESNKDSYDQAIEMLSYL